MTSILVGGTRAGLLEKVNEAKRNAGPVKPGKAHRQEMLESEYNKERSAQQIDDLKAEAKYPPHSELILFKLHAVATNWLFQLYTFCTSYFVNQKVIMPYAGSELLAPSKTLDLLKGCM